MPTTYDVYAAIIEHAPCAAKDLPFSTPIYAHLKALVEDNLLTKSGKRYAPKKTPEAKNIFEIIKYSLKHNHDYKDVFRLRRLFGSISFPALGEQIVFHKGFEVCIDGSTEREILRCAWCMFNNRRIDIICRWHWS